MNNFLFTGRLTRDAELRMVGPNGIPTAFFTVAIRRENGSDTDFIPCKVTGQQAEWFVLNVKKGREIEARASIQTWRAEEGGQRYDRFIAKVEWFKARAKRTGQSDSN